MKYKSRSREKRTTIDPMLAARSEPVMGVKDPELSQKQTLGKRQPKVDDTKASASVKKAAKITPKDQFNFTNYVKSYRVKRVGKAKKRFPKLKRFAVLSMLVLVVVGGYSVFRLLSSASSVFSGNYLGMISKEPLAKDKYGRSNILVFGTSEDVDGHSGAELTDSIMLVSVDQDSKASNVISIPRDLWVAYQESCPMGREGKINSVYACGLQNGKDEKQASEDLTGAVSRVLGTDVQYFAKVNYTVLRDLVNELDGIDVVIESSDPRGIQDRSMDKKCPDGPYTCYMVNYPNGPAKLNGDQALALARARNAKGGYGLSRGNFDREKNQQKIVRAIQKKALSTGTLTNPNRVFGIVDSLGSNIVTNFKTSQIQTLIGIARSINADSATTIELASDDQPLMTTGSHSGQSIVRPVAGLHIYDDIHRAIRDAFTLRSDHANSSDSAPDASSL